MDDVTLGSGVLRWFPFYPPKIFPRELGGILLDLILKRRWQSMYSGTAPQILLQWSPWNFCGSLCKLAVHFRTHYM